MALEPIVLLLAGSSSFVVSWLCFFLSRTFTPQIVGATYQNMSRDQKAAWDTRVVSSVHAVISFTGAFTSLMLFDYRSGEWLIFGQDSLMELFVVISVGYFCQDIIVILYERGAMWSLPDVIHHFVIITDMLLCLFTHTFLFYTMWSVCGEISTPFLHFRYMLQKINKPIAWLDYVFAALFMISRPISYAFQIWHCISSYALWQSSWVAHFQFLLGISFTALNYYWAAQIVQAALTMLPSSKKKAT